MNEVRISPPPKFDFEKAISAKEYTNSIGLRSLPGVQAAANLILYNYPYKSLTKPFLKIKNLKVAELAASKKDSLLPTIGIEVETPRKVFNPQNSGIHALFFDFIGLPRNRIHENLIPGDASTYQMVRFWEFSTHPTSSSQVVCRTLCELIKGGFIPYIIGSKSAEDRYNLLDDKLVSLHINLGIPPWLNNNGKMPNYNNENIQILATSVTLAFSSQSRLVKRSQNELLTCKSAEKTQKFPDTYFRLELKALEVGSFETYRLIKEVQYLAAATFASEAKLVTPVTNIWDNTRNEINNVYSKYRLRPDLLKDKNYAKNIQDYNAMQTQLRNVLTTHALQIYKFINK